MGKTRKKERREARKRSEKRRPALLFAATVLLAGWPVMVSESFFAGYVMMALGVLVVAVAFWPEVEHRWPPIRGLWKRMAMAVVYITIAGAVYLWVRPGVVWAQSFSSTLRGGECFLSWFNVLNNGAPTSFSDWGMSVVDRNGVVWPLEIEPPDPTTALVLPSGARVEMAREDHAALALRRDIPRKDNQLVWAIGCSTGDPIPRRITADTMTIIRFTFTEAPDKPTSIEFHHDPYRPSLGDALDSIPVSRRPRVQGGPINGLELEIMSLWMVVLPDSSRLYWYEMMLRNFGDSTRIMSWDAQAQYDGGGPEVDLDCINGFHLAAEDVARVERPDPTSPVGPPLDEVALGLIGRRAHIPVTLFCRVPDLVPDRELGVRHAVRVLPFAGRVAIDEWTPDQDRMFYYAPTPLGSDRVGLRSPAGEAGDPGT